MDDKFTDYKSLTESKKETKSCCYSLFCCSPTNENVNFILTLRRYLKLST